MFRKLILAAVVSTATAATASAQPFPVPTGPYGPNGPSYPHHDRHDYEVLVRHHGHWDRYGVFDDLHDARRAVWHLEREERDARIEVVHRHW
jgi:hypothetical protein